MVRLCLRVCEHMCTIHISFRFDWIRFAALSVKFSSVRFTSVSNFRILCHTLMQYAAEYAYGVCVHKFCCLPLYNMDCVSFVHRYAWAMSGGSGGQKFVTKWMKNSTQMTTGDIEPNTHCNCHSMIVRIDYTFSSVWFDFSSTLFAHHNVGHLSWVCVEKCFYRTTMPQEYSNNNKTTSLLRWSSKKGASAYSICLS